jgi:hypothetical protein
MKESEIEKYFKWCIERMGGKSWKFTSPGVSGVVDRIAALPDGRTLWVELKTKGGKLSELQKRHGLELVKLKQNYTVLWTKEQIDAYITTLSE